MTQFDLVVLVALLSAGYVFGQYSERRHFRSIRAREEAMAALPVFAGRLLPALPGAVDCTLVAGSSVVAFDYFRSFVAGLRNRFGGRLTSYETLVERARREAMLRMKQEAVDIGAAMIVNVKAETIAVAGAGQGMRCVVEVMVYGTALVPRRG